MKEDWWALGGKVRLSGQFLLGGLEATALYHWNWQYFDRYHSFTGVCTPSEQTELVFSPDFSSLG